MKYLTLFALTKAIKISDQETCSSTPQAYLVQNGLKVEALAQVDAEVDEKFTFGLDGLIKDNGSVAEDLFQIGSVLGVSDASTRWGTLEGKDDDLHVFLKTIHDSIDATYAITVKNQSALVTLESSV
jgi:hypothetical protein